MKQLLNRQCSKFSFYFIQVFGVGNAKLVLKNTIGFTVRIVFSRITSYVIVVIAHLILTLLVWLAAKTLFLALERISCLACS